MSSIFADNADLYYKLGLSPIPIVLGQKRPAIPKWQNYCDRQPTPEELEGWKRKYPDHGIGLACGIEVRPGFRLIAIDVDAEDLVAPVASAIGRPAPVKVGKKGQTFFVLADQKSAKNLKLKRKNADGKPEPKPAAEFLGHGSETVLPPTIHPDTGKPYVWLGRSLLEWPSNGRGPNLPVINEWVIDEISAVCEGRGEHFRALNEMVWLGVGCGGNTHDICVAATASLVARGWPDGVILERIKRAKREACERHGERFDWPEADQTIQEWIESARRKREEEWHKSEDPQPVLVCLGDVQPEEVNWCWERRVARGKLTLLIGEPSAGKSRITHDIIARITRGLAWPDGGRAPAGSVVLLACEDGLADTVRPSIERQGGDPTMVHVLTAVLTKGAEAPVRLDRDLPALTQALETHKAVALVIDPISAYLGDKDSYKDAEIRGVLDPLAALAARYRVAVAAVLHLTKAQERKLLLRAQGSVAFVALARIVLVAGEDPQTPAEPKRRLLASIKNNLGPSAPTLAFSITSEGLSWHSKPVEGDAEKLFLVDEMTTRTERSERDEAKAFLLEVLKDGPVASKQVEADAKANGISQRTLWRAKRELGVKTAQTWASSRPGPWEWYLPTTDPLPPRGF